MLFCIIIRVFIRLYYPLFKLSLWRLFLVTKISVINGWDWFLRWKSWCLFALNWAYNIFSMTSLFAPLHLLRQRFHIHFDCLKVLEKWLNEDPINIINLFRWRPFILSLLMFHLLRRWLYLLCLCALVDIQLFTFSNSFSIVAFKSILELIVDVFTLFYLSLQLIDLHLKLLKSYFWVFFVCFIGFITDFVVFYLLV